MPNINKTIPFSFSVDKSQTIFCLEIYENFAYAGTGPNGVILRSLNRNFWEQYYITDDIHVNCLFAFNGFLYVGTSPLGYIYIIDLSDNSLKNSNMIGNKIINFTSINNIIYAFSEKNVYFYDEINEKWDFLYKASDIINCVYSDNNIFYLGLNGPNIISYDGEKWSLLTNSADNFYSFRNVSKNPFFHLNENFINRESIIRTDDLNNEIVYDIFPINFIKGISSISKDGSTLIFGSSNYGRVFRLDEKLNIFFQTDEKNVYDLLNIDENINLAAIGDKVYFLRCYEENNEENQEEIPEENNNEIEESNSSNFTLISPLEGDIYEIGSFMVIQWTSKRGTNEGVKLELNKNGELFQVINSKTSNDGEYEWFLSSDLEEGNDYSIKISWSTTGEVSEEDQVESGKFSLTFILQQEPEITEETNESSSNKVLKLCQGIPILNLLNDHVVCIKKDIKNNQVLFGTYNGKILSCNYLSINSYLTSKRNVYAEAVDGFGHISELSSIDILYSLYKKIIEISDKKSIVRWNFAENSVPLNNERGCGIFISPILYVKEDLGLWKDFTWTENKPEKSEITFCLRSSDSIDKLYQEDWIYCFDSSGKTLPYTQSIDSLIINGKYLQFKVIMYTDLQFVTPIVVSTGISYSTKNSVYFFTTKFSLEKNSNAKIGLITANITEPLNTEISFGISNLNSNDWNDYESININRFFSMKDFNNLKVGIKFSSFNENIPKVSEFSFMYGADVDSVLI